jgi:hypothetical protein
VVSSVKGRGLPDLVVPVVASGVNGGGLPDFVVPVVAAGVNGVGLPDFVVPGVVANVNRVGLPDFVVHIPILNGIGFSHLGALIIVTGVNLFRLLELLRRSNQIESIAADEQTRSSEVNGSTNLEEEARATQRLFRRSSL